MFAFNTHMDVVPVGGGWSGDPLRLAAREGRYYGRGTCDCKGPLAAMVEAIRMLVADRTSWSGTLLAVFVADEEVASEGARRFAASRPAIDYAVVGEPTSNQVVIAHKGSLRPLVRVEGTMAHSSTPDLGENAIYGAARFVPLVEAFHRDVVRHRTHPLVGAASLTITRCTAGVADNVVPDRCDLLLDRRMVPGEDEGAVRAEIEALVASAHAGSACGRASRSIARPPAARPRSPPTGPSCAPRWPRASDTAPPTPDRSGSREPATSSTSAVSARTGW